MRAAKVDGRRRLHRGVVHSFTKPEADKAGDPARTEMLGLFDEVFA